MKHTALADPIILAVTSLSAACAFVCSYFLQLYMNNQDQYTAVVGVMFLDGVFGIIAGTKGTAWLSEVVIVPFMVFQLVSALKNASMAGYIKVGLLNEILDKIDNHKGKRQE